MKNNIELILEFSKVNAVKLAILIVEPPAPRPRPVWLDTGDHWRVYDRDPTEDRSGLDEDRYLNSQYWQAEGLKIDFEQLSKKFNGSLEGCRKTIPSEHHDAFAALIANMTALALWDCRKSKKETQRPKIVDRALTSAMTVISSHQFSFAQVQDIAKVILVDRVLRQ